MSAFARRLETLHATRPVTVLGAAVIDVIADAYALPWRGCDIELKQQGVNNWRLRAEYRHRPQAARHCSAKRASRWPRRVGRYYP